jgi:FPC/CPF motif-containing protein YcgG
VGRPVDIDGGVTIVTLNPFAGSAALRYSNYCLHDGTQLVHPHREEKPSVLTEFVHDSVLALALNPHFTCVGAKSALRQRAYRFGLYPELGSPSSTAGLARDLFTFTQEAPEMDADFTTFIASFEGPAVPDERSFETLLWETLQELHHVDVPHHGWDASVSADASDPQFAFSFAQTAFFIVGLHAASSRATRRFAWPTLVFNPHRQFEELKANGRYERFQQVIRSAERTLQGDVNPMLADFGHRSEAAQYSGRKVGNDWRCPFHSHAQPANDRDEP